MADMPTAEAYAHRAFERYGLEVAEKSALLFTPKKGARDFPPNEAHVAGEGVELGERARRSMKKSFELCEEPCAPDLQPFRTLVPNRPSS
jgi:hypothetical protein